MALASPYKKQLKEAEEELETLQAASVPDTEALKTLQKKIEHLKRKYKPFHLSITIDLRYNYRVRVPSPSTQAVMFCVMDVSGSWMKLKKILLNDFLFYSICF